MSTSHPRTPASVDLDWAAGWLAQIGHETAPPLTTHRIGTGLSNLTYQVDDAGGRTWVMRRPPSGSLLISAHDVLREARIMDALASTTVPVPQILGARHDPAGVPWILMQHVDGLVLDDMSIARRLAMADRTAIGLDMVATLGLIHDVDLAAVGLVDLASHRPYAPRQLKRWTQQWNAARTSDLPDLQSLTTRLERSIPDQSQTTLVHGDFHVKNVITDRGRVVAVLDWELSTLGDPLADLGTLLAYWPAGGESRAGDETFPSTLPGFPSRSQLVEHYTIVTGRDVSGVGFWHALGLWKIAIIAEGVLRRSVDSPHDRAAAGVPSRDDVDQLVDHAHSIADDASL